MTSLVSKGADTIFPGAGTVGKKAGDEITEELLPGAPGAPSSAASPLDSRVENRTEEFAVREQLLGRRASAAGVQRSSNDADLLGYVTPRPRGAARRSLGGL
jgi:hypothetical protein